MRRRDYDSGPRCVTCGMFAINVVHDDEATRARNIETWAFATPGMDGQDYYTWAGLVYHPFMASYPPSRHVSPSRQRDNEYRRGYQAGYHAGIRERKTPVAMRAAADKMDEAIG